MSSNVPASSAEEPRRDPSADRQLGEALSAERFHPMSDTEFDYARIDPGIRDVVRQLRDLGFDTCDSGDGVSKPAEWYESGEAMPFPHVVVQVVTSSPAPSHIGYDLVVQSRNLQHVLGDAWEVEGTYYPKTGHLILLATKGARPDRSESVNVEGVPV